jgi:hypothetical protein
LSIGTLLRRLLPGSPSAAKADKQVAAGVIDLTGRTLQATITEAGYLELNAGQKRAFVIGAGDMVECLAVYLAPQAQPRFAAMLLHWRQLGTDGAVVAFDEYIRSHPEIGPSGRTPGAASSFLSMLINATQSSPAP